jgi:hypothetical protein
MLKGVQVFFFFFFCQPYFSLDDPNPGVARPGLRNIPFDTPGSIRSRMPMMEGYAFITLDTSLSELGDGQTVCIHNTACVVNMKLNFICIL